jgi:DNA-binding CsgD family transcriptional regulator
MPPGYAAVFESLEREWGQPGTLMASSPSMANDPRFIEWTARHSRLAASPGAAAAIMRAYVETDVRAAAEALHVPALILHRTRDRMCDVSQGRDLAARVPSAKYVELPGEDHTWHVGDTMSLLDEVEQFLTGERSRPDSDRVLATVMFSQPGDPSQAASGILQGIEEWARAELPRFGGRQVSMAGGAIFAAFDGPGRAARCAMAIRDRARRLGVDLRTGIHTGECEVHGDLVDGVAVRIAARVQAAAAPSEILVSSTVKELVVGSGLAFADRGTHRLTGVPGEWRLFALDEHPAHPASDRLSHTPTEGLPAAAAAGLSPAEVEVLTLLARGLTNAQIAAVRTVAPATIATHVKHIFEKTGVANRAEAAAWAVRHGIG